MSTQHLCRVCSVFLLKLPVKYSFVQEARQLRFVRSASSDMSKRKGPSDDNLNGGIVDFLMGVYPFEGEKPCLYIFLLVYNSRPCVCGTQGEKWVGFYATMLSRTTWLFRSLRLLWPSVSDAAFCSCALFQSNTCVPFHPPPVIVIYHCWMTTPSERKKSREPAKLNGMGCVWPSVGGIHSRFQD